MLGRFGTRIWVFKTIKRANCANIHVMKVRDVIKLIEADGWYLIVTKGSHRQYKHPTKPGRVTVAG